MLLLTQLIDSLLQGVHRSGIITQVRVPSRIISSKKTTMVSKVDVSKFLEATQSILKLDQLSPVSLELLLVPFSFD